MSNFSDSYVTPSEFAQFCVEVARDCGYFVGNDRQHPEDIAINLAVVVQAVAAGWGEGARRAAGIRP